MNRGRREMSEGTGEYLVTKEDVASAFTLGLYDPAAQAKRTTEGLRKGPTR